MMKFILIVLHYLMVLMFITAALVFIYLTINGGTEVLTPMDCFFNSCLFLIYSILGSFASIIFKEI